MVVINPYQKKPSFLKPEKVILEVGLEKGQTVLDYGSGAGYWSIPLSKAVGPKGEVVAVDNDPSRLEALRVKAVRASYGNIKPVLDESSRKAVPTKQKFNFILIANILSEISNHDDLLQEISKNCTEGSRLLVVDWNKESLLGPAEDCRLLEDEVIFIAAQAGFKFNHTLDAGSFHYGLLFDFTGEKYEKRKK